MTEVAEVTAGLGTLALLEQAGQITPTGLTLSPGMPFEQWASLGEFLGDVKNRTSWYIGDWINFGEDEYSTDDRYAQAMDATGLAYHTLQNYAWTCRRVPHARRREDLRFGHHTVVSSLTPAEQRHWLAETAKHGWSRAHLKDAIARVRNPQPEPEPLPAAEPSSRQVIDAGRDLTTVRETLVAAAEVVDVGPAIEALDNAGATIRAAISAAPSAWQIAHRLVGEAVVHDAERYLVPRETLDELRSLVMDEGGSV